ncbi:TRAP transporter large permease subunit [Lachnospiraceae bacterium WCA-9-b2]|jgi:tripartite ATP-independent transporter DctM subunit|uniref:TRAP transporter large permease subunit n=1 Tax=Sporofaciens musculi TaxID=2681861 RepID=A0A7X3SLK8_9FIRM|nr:TRAP transporter large permease [Sporofaciens musculi]MXP78461.1 TRAP transporter large permease subunit [Sporofaciens musculi]
MSPIAAAAIVMLLLLFLNVPVFASVLGGCIAYFFANPDAGITGVLAIQRVISGMQSTTMLAIPFFVAAGALMNYCGITERMLNFCKVLTGRMYGGLGQVNIVLSTLMGGMSGSSLADAAMEAKLLVPDMEKAGYSKGYASAITAASSMITPLIPPGIAAIIYGSITGTSIGKLFVAGIVPAIILCVTMMTIVSKYSRKKGIPRLREEKIESKELWKAFKPAVLPLLLPVIIIGSIRLGICTPTEAGAVAIFYALFLGIVYREIRLENMFVCVKETAVTTASIMLIVGAATCFSWILTWENVPQNMTKVLISLCHNKYIFLFAVNIFLLIVGMFIEATAAQIVLAPMLVPVAIAFGIDPVHFGMVFIFNMAIGSLTPPMGNLMFVTCGVTKCSTEEFIKECRVFYVMLFGMLLLMSYVPLLSTWLPNLIYGV